MINSWLKILTQVADEMTLVQYVVGLCNFETSLRADIRDGKCYIKPEKGKFVQGKQVISILETKYGKKLIKEYKEARKFIDKETMRMYG